MARKAMIEKSKKSPKFKVRARNRCNICGRSRGYIRDFGICRICFRNLASKGEIPGITKSSW
ncbi:MAG TPA: type Z 30S ribosomal protein S14 [Desulfurella acetivorans]|uniref:Small ribosomal subunit protein uS14 n=1 Tax=Desulfurella acetivorans TaxID=33002 RepID=A0A7C6EBB4_DESAE|nr:type Z 30S ribosomal protein S14 [Desulfurella acetivorans]